jgi:hypothetical protein
MWSAKGCIMTIATITEHEKRCEHWCKPANQALAEQDGLDTTNSEIFADLPQYRLIRAVKGFPLARGADFLSVFEKPQRDALAMLFLNLHGQGFVAGEIFCGLWLLPGALTYRSRFLPRFLGVWLILNGFAYLVLSFTGLLLAQYEDRVL